MLTSGRNTWAPVSCKAESQSASPVLPAETEVSVIGSYSSELVPALDPIETLNIFPFGSSVHPSSLPLYYLSFI